MSATHELRLPYRPKASAAAQSWAEWWSANIPDSTVPDQRLVYRDRLADQLASLGPINSASAEARLLKLARRDAWRKQQQQQQQTKSTPYLGWPERVEPLSGSQSVSRIARANVLENMTDRIAQESGNEHVSGTSAERSLDTPSMQKLHETHDECVEAIRDYIDQDPDSDVPWTEEHGLAMPLTRRFKPKGLLRDTHQAFLMQLIGRLPAGFAALDAARPWVFYWVANALRVMGFEFDKALALVDTLTPIQNREGGFGGGQGQLSHLATTYASTLAMVCCGQPETAMRLVDRQELYEWLGRLKQPDGAFTMAEGGEVDNRAVYIVMVLVNLYNLPRDLPASSPARAHGHTKFQDGIGEYVRKCQSFEGGIGCNPNTEAHGAYTFCSLGALCLLDPQKGPENIHQWVQFDALVEWIQWRQDDVTGGLAGRTNKVVDNCYSHWIGGCWPLLENAIGGRPELFNRDALALYILSAGQEDDGGLRDKPSMAADGYHTCYGLAGLAMCTHRWTFDAGQWSHRRYDAEHDAGLAPLHPVYVVPADCAEAALDYFRHRPLVV